MNKFSFYIKDNNFVKGNEWWEYKCPNLNTYMFIRIIGESFIDASNWVRYGVDHEYLSYLNDNKISKPTKNKIIKNLLKMNVVKTKPHKW